MVCEEITQGIRLLSKVRRWTMPVAKRMPSPVPMAKPSKVEESVTQAWNTKLRLEVIFLSRMVFFISTRIWCGAGSSGRSWAKVARTRSPVVHSTF